MKKGYFFESTDITYDEYLNSVNNVIKEGSFICSKDTLEVGMLSLTKLDDENLRKKLIEISVLIDRQFPSSERSTYSDQKLPVIMSMANILANHYDYVKTLENNELLLLGIFSSVVEPIHIEENLKVIADKNILSAVIEKTSNYEEQMQMLQVVENKYCEVIYDKENFEEIERFKKESYMAIKDSSKEEFINRGEWLVGFFELDVNKK